MRICRDPRDAAARLMTLRRVLEERKARDAAKAGEKPATDDLPPAPASGIAWNRIATVAVWGAGYGMLLGMLALAWLLACAATSGAQIAE